MNLLKKLLISTIIVLLLSYFLKPGVQVDGFVTALIVAVVLGLLNTFVKPVLVFFTLPITFFTLGLFLLVINTIMVYVCDYIVDGFNVNSFLTAMIFSILLSVSQWILYKFIKD